MPPKLPRIRVIQIALLPGREDRIAAHAGRRIAWRKLIDTGADHDENLGEIGRQMHEVEGGVEQAPVSDTRDHQGTQRHPEGCGSNLCSLRYAIGQNTRQATVS